MIHLASRAFYEKISNDLSRYECILFEGVTWDKNGVGKPIYDWAAKNLGLVTQRDSLKFPESAVKINIDMPGAEFRERLNDLSVLYRVSFRMLRPLLWLTTKFPAGKNYMIHSMATKEARKYGECQTDMDELIIKDRDNHICGKLRIYIEKYFSTKEKLNTAIVFGANHMISISHCLRELGFKPKTTKWFHLIELDDSENEEEILQPS